MGKTTPKIKGIPLEQAQMYAQYGIESLGLKRKTEKKAQKKLLPKTEIWCLVKRCTVLHWGVPENDYSVPRIVGILCP